jgi:hypothetical protein
MTRQTPGLPFPTAQTTSAETRAAAPAATNLDRHLLAGAWSLDQLRQGEAVTTLGGQALEVAPGEVPRVNGVTVLAEQRLGNARVFLVDGLL